MEKGLISATGQAATQAFLGINLRPKDVMETLKGDAFEGEEKMLI